MVPNLATGSSFRGAQLYYLHDKREKGELLRLSDERVEWTETRNTAHDAADAAFAEMIATAHDQDQLKIMSGQRLSGRPVEQPVMTISLSWHPSEKPDKEQMLEAADSYIEHMRWDEHQAVYLAHNDTAHAHLHIILNRIHPETGRVLDDAFSKNRTQEWAREYEREHGRIWCEERIGKDYSKADGKDPRALPHDFAIDAREAQQPYAKLEEVARTLDAREKAQLSQHHQDEREAFFDGRHQQFRQARETAYRDVRGDYKERWIQHFHEAEQARRQAERDAANLALRILEFARQAEFTAAWQSVSDRDAVRRDVEQEISEQRKELRARQREETREHQDEACAALYEERAQAYLQIKQRQKEERDQLKELQAARAEGQPYDKERLTELVTEPVAERLPDTAPDEREAQSEAAEEGRGVDADELTVEPENFADAATTPFDPTLDNTPERILETGHGQAETLVTGASDGLAGGIGKLAEILADVIAGLIAPETEQDRAAKRQHAKAQAERTPEPPVTQQPGPRTSFSLEDAERLKREHDEWWQKRNEQNRER